MSFKNYTNFGLEEFIKENTPSVEESLEQNIDFAIKVFGNKNGKIKGSNFILEKNGEEVHKVPIDVFKYCIEHRLDLYLEEFEKTSNALGEQGIDLFQDIEEQLYQKHGIDIGLLDVSNFVLTHQRALSIFPMNRPDFLMTANRIKKQFEKLKGMMSEQNFEKYAFIASYLGFVNPNAIELFDSKVNGKDIYYTENDAIEIIKKYSSKKAIRDCSQILLDFVLNAPTSYIRRLDKMEYFSDRAKGALHYSFDNLKSCKKNLNYEGRFFDGQTCATAYKMGRVSGEFFLKYMNIQKLFNEEYLVRNDNKDFINKYGESLYFIDNEDGKLTRRDHGKMIMDMIHKISEGKPLSIDNKEHCTVGAWNYYINGFFSSDDIKTLIKEGAMFEEDILKDFIDLHKIGNELGEDQKPIVSKSDGYMIFPYIFDADKVYDVFDTDILVRYFCEKELPEQVRIYINKHLKKQCEKSGRNLSEDFFESALKLFEEQNYDDTQKARALYNLYCKNMITAEQICCQEVSEDTVNLIVDLGKDNNSAIIDFYNCGFIDEYQLFDKYGEDVVIDLINNGLNPLVLNEFYSFEEVVDLILDKKITRACDMSYYRNEENIKKINKMYQPTRLDKNSSNQDVNDMYTYDDLNTLVLYRILTAEEAEEIDKDYDYNEKINILRENGLIVGNKKGIKVERGEDGKSDSTYSGNPGEIEIANRYELFFALDDECDEYSISSDVLKNYSLIIFPKLKIAVMEPTEKGEGASYVMSIKLALDQISNDQNDGENKEDPLKVYKNRTGIRSIPGMEVANHGANWGRNLVKKMKNIHSDVPKAIFADDSEEKAKEHKLEIETIQEKVRNDYLKTRNETNLNL